MVLIVKQHVFSILCKFLIIIFTGNTMLQLVLFSLFFFSYSLNAMDGKIGQAQAANVCRDISIIDAYLDGNFKLYESNGETVFEFVNLLGVSIGAKTQIPLKLAAMVIFQMRRDRCQTAKFHEQLNALRAKLKNPSYVALKPEDIKVFQEWRLLMFDSNQDLTKERASILKGTGAELDKQTWGEPTLKVRALQNAKKILNDQEEQIRANREAYKNAFGSIVDLELINEYKSSLLRWNFKCVDHALEDMRIAYQKGLNPLEITQF